MIDTSLAEPLSAMPNQPPSWETPFGSDSQGRDLLAVLVLGTGLTMKVGLLAGAMGIAIGTVVGLVSAYYGGLVDLVLRWVVDVGLTIPPLLLLIVIASAMRGHLDSTGMALIIGSLSWFGPARQIRAQALVMRQRGLRADRPARAGAAAPAIIFLEIMPNLLPFLMAALVLAASSRDPVLGGARRARAGADGRADAGHDGVLDALLHRLHARAVVVDPAPIVMLVDPVRRHSIWSARGSTNSPTRVCGSARMNEGLDRRRV